MSDKTVHKKTRILVLLAAIGALVVGGLAIGLGLFAFSPSSMMKNDRFGAAFELVDQNSNKITDQDLLGKAHAIFFGFTHCPEICPTTLFEASGWLKKLGPDADKLGVYFVTVDPERDTPQIMKDYLSPFDERISAISGPPEKVLELVRSYKVYFKKVPTDDGDYTMDHTASVLLFNADGSFAKTISWGEDADIALKKLKDLIANND